MLLTATGQQHLVLITPSLGKGTEGLRCLCRARQALATSPDPALNTTLGEKFLSPAVPLDKEKLNNSFGVHVYNKESGYW